VGPQFPGQDKLLHLVAYTIMSVLVCRALATLRSMRSLWTICLAGILVTVLFGLSDEWHQSFVPGRNAEGWDLAADAAGALLGAAVYSWRRRRRTSRASFSLVDK
jgi:VanZ family protein